MIKICNTSFMSSPQSAQHASVAFLLAQVGASAAREFTKALTPLNFSPPEAGILRLLGRSPGIIQQELAKRLDMHASRLVAVIDELEKRGLVARETNPADRRVYSLRLTQTGIDALAAIGAVARTHNEAICNGLDDSERLQLAALLGKIAEQQGLTPGVHPGYQELQMRGGATARTEPRTPE
jgi:DNA-binding MarR family transcriptional regulator